MALSSKAHVLFLFPNSVRAFLAFKPNCSLPPEVVQYAANPQVRGTLQILWTCLAVLILCTWSVQHPAVPIHDDHLRPPSRPRRLGLSLLSFLAKLLRFKKSPVRWNEFFDEVRWHFDRVKWMGTVVLCPEFYFAKALTENCAANDSTRFMQVDEWTTLHGFFANMRGFVMTFESTAVKVPMKPRTATKLGRRLSKPCPGGVPTVYYRQDYEQAAAIELQQCEEVCGTRCQFRMERQGSEIQVQPVTRDKEAEKKVIQKSWTDGSLDDEPIDKRTLVAALNTTMVPFAANIVNSPELLTGTTLVNSPMYPRPRIRHDTFTPSLAHSSTLRSETIYEETDRPDTATTTEKPSSGKQSVEKPTNISISQPRVLPHPPWTGSWPLSALQLHRAYTLGLIPPPPYIKSQDLRNQSKSDGLIKILTTWQILWLTITILVRASQNLSITILEVTVLAFATTAMATYVLLWHKPQDVKVPHTIQALRRINREDVIELAALSPLSTMKVYEFFLHGVAVRAMGDGVFPFTRGLRTSTMKRLWKPWRWFRQRKDRPSHGEEGEEEEVKETKQEEEQTTTTPEVYMNPVPLGIGVGGAIFGAVHMTAFNFTFPTSVEKLLWRISCGLLIGLPAVCVAIYSGYMHYTKKWQGKKRDDSRVRVVLLRFGEALIPIYLLARAFLFMETFRSLAYCEVSAFKEVNWPTAIPHYI